MKYCCSFLMLLAAMVLLNGCANKVAPLGGDKDVKPPVITASIPENGSLQFNAKEIVITFDEYVQLKDASKQIVISPLMEPAPEITVRKKSVVVALNAPLKPSTTYVISFGNAISDLHEGNILPSLRYVFSTGTYIDSLNVTGTITDALTGKPSDGAMALLYRAPVADTLPLNATPDYFAKSDASGKFDISNIAVGNYRLYGLDDKNSNFRLDPSDEKAGFYQQVIFLPDSQTIHLRLTKQWPALQLIKSAIVQEPGKLLTVFSRPVTDPDVNMLNSGSGIINTEFNSTRDSVIIYVSPFQSDSLTAVWYDGKTLIDTVRYRISRGTVVNNKLLTGAVYPQRGNPLQGESKPFVQWNHPVAAVDSARISVFRDSVPVRTEITFVDTLKTRMQFSGTEAEGNYRILILPGAVSDGFSRSNDTIQTTFAVDPSRGKGTITYHLQTPDVPTGILQLLNDKDEVVRSRKLNTGDSGTFTALAPGIYSLRLIADINQNGIWDAGEVLRQLPPEIILFYSEKITVRANWDVDIDWKVNHP